MKTTAISFRGQCEACPRECVGFGWFDPAVKSWTDPRIKKNSHFHYCCSIECADTLQQRKGIMDDPTPHEVGSMVDAGMKGGEYLDSIKKTDLAILSHDEFHMFIESVVTGFCDSMRQRASMTMKPIETEGNGT